MKNIPLTEQVHSRLAKMITPGDRVIDATAGNGHDTRFLAERVGDEGRVFAIDIQQHAIDSARTRLETVGLSHRVEWLCAGHEKLAQLISPDLHGSLNVIMFNLGYLPGSDKMTQTQIETTLPALQQAYALLKHGGLLSVIAYPGHVGGEQETDAVRNWFESLTNNDYERVVPDSQFENAPQWYCLIKSG